MTSQRDAAAGDPKYFGRPTGPARPPTPSLSTGRRSAPRYFYTFLLRTLPGVILICLIDTSFTVNVTGINNTNHTARTFPRDSTDLVPFQSNSIFILYFHLHLRFPKSHFPKDFSTEILHVMYKHFCLPHFKCACPSHLKVEHLANTHTHTHTLSLSVSYGASARIRGMASLISWGSKQVSFYEVGLLALRPTPSNAGGPMDCSSSGFPPPTLLAWEALPTASTAWRSVATPTVSTLHGLIPSSCVVAPCISKIH